VRERERDFLDIMQLVDLKKDKAMAIPFRGPSMICNSIFNSNEVIHKNS